MGVDDAFETFIGPSLKGSQGQFFTPRYVTNLVRSLVRPKIGDMVLEKSVTFGDKNQWEAQFDWIIDVMLEMKKAFKKHL
ncbi:DUF4268 domain-containing protein [Schaalia sp. ZJ405]|uniref:DUF4268 domain-containing protein n=1 Tax=Schaalia sp. ZJ405 TaxID=2709403 RepID=UPI0018C9D3EC|nr:DUF4268 domain-containing protein [Schaalia sp. ZJ405]